jgi:predicted PolB exonuclease-like 3'-5' exonuclease
MNDSPIIFDIETGPLDEWEVAHLMPQFSAPSNYKDEAKIAASIEEQRKTWLEKRALSASTGQVIAIGIREDGEFSYLTNIGGEADMLRHWWAIIAENGVITQKIVGFNSNRFDLPFLIRRSWKLRVEIPATILSGRYLNNYCIDLMELWQCGDRQASISLDSLAKFLGVGAKNGDGAFFHELWETDRDAALAYLENDLLLTELCAQAMGVK